MITLGLPLAGVRPAFAQTVEPADPPSPELSPTAPESAPEAPLPDENVEPPRVQQRTAAKYPESARAAGVEGTVELLVTVMADGSVGEVTVNVSRGPTLDAAAVEAVRGWLFQPALQGGQPRTARIRVPITFSLEQPVSALEQPASAPQNAAPPPPTNTAPDRSQAIPLEPRQPPVEVTIEGSRKRRQTQRTASDFAVRRDVLEAAPRHEGVEVLRAAPGMYIARPEGAAVAHRYMLRGFDSEHGQDIEFRVAGLPINLPSHIHGQGYADLGFLIAETVDELRVTEGVHDPRQGDFAVAGTIDVSLGVQKRGLHSQTSYGSFNSFRQLVQWAPPSQLRDSFGAVSFQRTDGFGENRRGESISAVIQQGLGSEDWRTRLIGIFYGARSDMAGVLRRQDIDEGTVGFYDVYPYPTARAQNGFAGRAMTGAFANYTGQQGGTAELGAWLGADVFRLQENFTGFLQRSQTLPNVSGQGDLIEQRNRTNSLGLSASYRSTPYRPASWLEGYVELGTTARFDHVEQSQNLLNAAVRLQTWDERVDAEIEAMDIGVFGDLDFHLGHALKWRLGLRADALAYEVSDKLGNRAPATRNSDAFIKGFRRSAYGVAVGPRTSTDFEATEWLTLHASYGEGYRSPQARTLDDGERTPFTKVYSADIGTRFHFDSRYEVTLAGYRTDLSDDVAFEAREGRLERVGQTRRLGAVLHVEARPASSFVAAASVTYVDAELLEPPPATPTDPTPAFEKGQNLPYVPPLVARADLGLSGQLLPDSFVGQSVGGELGLGFSVLSARPLPFGQFADPLALLDISGGVSVQNISLGIDVFNLLDSRYSAVEYSFVSDWDPDTPGSRLPTRHSSAGAPRTIMGKLGVSL